MSHEAQYDPRRLERHRDYLRLVARINMPLRLQSKLEPSDIVQQTLLKAHQNFNGFSGQTEAELAAWLARILANTLADEIRRFGGAKRDVALERSLEAAVVQSSERLGSLLSGDVTSPSQGAIRQEEILQLTSALDRLPEDQQIAVELHHLRGCSVSEIADQMSRSETSVAGLLRRGLKTLRQLLQGDRGPAD